MKGILTLIILVLIIQLGHSQKYENLIFEGAGIRGIAYSGVLTELEKCNIIDDIVKVGGTSAGAITALMVSIGYSSSEIFDIISDTKFQKFNDGEYMFIGGFSRLNSKYGWYKGEAFIKWLDKIIIAKNVKSGLFKDYEFLEMITENNYSVPFKSEIIVHQSAIRLKARRAEY